MKKRYLIAGLSGAAAAAVATRLLTRPDDVEWERSRNVVFHSEHSRFIRVDGLRVHYQDVGDPEAPPLLVIHGFCSSTLVWSKVLLELGATGLRVIAPDLLGYGFSDKSRKLQYTIGSQARMIVAFLDELAIEQAIVVGSSYGGAIAATIALDYGNRVSKLVLVGAVTNNTPTRYILMRLLGSPILGDIVSPLLVSSRRLLRWRMKRVYDRHCWVLDERRVDARHLTLRSAGTHRAIVRTIRRWDADRIQRDAHLIRQPTLLLWGENDPDTPLRDGELLQQQIAGSRLLVFRNCGHLPQEEFPQAFTEAVSQFCLNGN